MISKIFFSILIIIMVADFTCVFSQVSINNTGLPPDASSALDVQHQNKGMLIPRMSKNSRDLIPSPANSLLIYQTDNEPGYYYNDGIPSSPLWKALVSSTNNALSYKTIINTLPYVITQPGSYVVIKNLQGSSGITVNSSNVSIDLNYFTISGNPGNASTGISVSAAQTNINIMNGCVRGWTNGGIIAPLTSNGQFLNLNLLNNADDGLTVGPNNVITNCVAAFNTFDGIDGDINCVFSLCSVNNNGDNGIEAEQNCTIDNCTAKSNTNNGIRSGHTSVISNCASNANTVAGIESGDGSTLINNTSSSNGASGFVLANGSYASHNVSRNNTAHGFLCYQDVNLIDNVSDSNLQNGFHSTFDGGKLDNNNSTDNVVGYFISGSSWLVTRNSANNNSGGGFSIAPSNTTANIITSATINTNTNPFANVNF